MRKSNTHNAIGYVLIDRFVTKKTKVCEAPRHKGMNLPAYAVLVTQGSMYPDGLVQMICYDCWKHFDDDMGNPNWKLEM
jgi:hypothetical protein